MKQTKASKTSISNVEPNTKVNVKYYCHVLLKKMNPEMNRLAKHNKYLFTQDGAGAHTAKFTFEMLKKRSNFIFQSPILQI